MEDRLESYKKLLETAGKLESLQGAKPGTGGKGTGDSDKKFAAGDTNQSGYVTPREQRAQERQQRKEDQARRAREREERAAEVGASERERQKQREQRMTEREQAAGLSGTTAGRDVGGTSANDKAAAENPKGTEAELKEQTKILITIKEEIQKNP